MRIAAHIATLAALVALSLALGRWLREPNAGGLIFLLLLTAVATLAARHLYRSPAPAPEPVAAAPAPAPAAPAEPEGPLATSAGVPVTRVSSVDPCRGQSERGSRDRPSACEVRTFTLAPRARWDVDAGQNGGIRVEAWGRSPDNPVGGWYGLKKGMRGRFGMYLPPLLEHLGLAEVEHHARNNRMRAR